jgi:hypothetical protein
VEEVIGMLADDIEGVIRDELARLDVEDAVVTRDLAKASDGGWNLTVESADGRGAPLHVHGTADDTMLDVTLGSVGQGEINVEREGRDAAIDAVLSDLRTALRGEYREALKFVGDQLVSGRGIVETPYGPRTVMRWSQFGGFLRKRRREDRRFEPYRRRAD